MGAAMQTDKELSGAAAPNRFPRGEGGPKGRERNSGRNLEVYTHDQTYS